jgi:hypothetical protein
MPEDEQQESWKPCAICAGTGRVRDRDNLSPFSASTYFTINPELFKDYDFTMMCGT